MIPPLQEHDIVPGILTPSERFDNLSLVSWAPPKEGKPRGYYASYKIGAEWVDDKETIVVTTKRGMEEIDFLGMFMTCFSSNLSVESFSKIYDIKVNQPPIAAPSLQSVLSPLIVFHFLGVVKRIKTLKRGYVHHSENLKKVKGHIETLNNERKNISVKRYDRIYCGFDEYSVDIPENRLLKKALLFSQRLVLGMGESHHSFAKVKQIISQTLHLYDNVSDNVEIKDIGQIRGHKLFKDYAEAIRLAKIVLKHFDYSINKVSEKDNRVVPFVLDMSLLYEHYVYGLLYEAYQNKITYQFGGKTGYPDFLFRSNAFQAILDTKYIPKYNNEPLDVYVIRQLSGYGRDIPVLRHLGYDDITEESPIPTVPCIIIYPEKAEEYKNPFLNKALEDLCTNRVPRLSQFYKISIPIPIIR